MYSSISRYQWQLCRWHAAGADLLFGVAPFEIHQHHMKVPESMSGVCSQSSGLHHMKVPSDNPVVLSDFPPRGCEGRCPSSVCERAAQEDDGSLDATGMMMFVDI